MIKREEKGGIWRVSKICKFLKKEIYKGTLVQHQTEEALYKNEKFHKISERQRKNMMEYRKILIKILFSVVNVIKKFHTVFREEMVILFSIVNGAEMVFFQVGKI